MTEKEAIERINEHIAIHRYNEPQAIRIAEALQMGIDALEKQMPKKPFNPELGISPRHPIIIHCGECGMELADHMWDYCPYCGQAIDW